MVMLVLQITRDGLFFETTNQDLIDNGFLVTLSRGGFVTQNVLLHVGTNRVVMVNDGEIANGISVSDVFDDWPSIMSSSNRAVTKAILENVWYDTAHTATTTDKFCISYTPGNPNNTDTNRFLRVGDVVRRRSYDGDMPLPDPEPFEPVIPEPQPEIGPNTDPSKYPELFTYVGSNPLLEIIISATPLANNSYYVWGTCTEMTNGLYCFRNFPGWSYVGNLWTSGYGGGDYTYLNYPPPGTDPNPNGRLLSYRRAYFRSAVFSAMGDTAKLELPVCEIHKARKSKLCSVPRVILVEEPNLQPNTFNNQELLFNEWQLVQYTAGVKLNTRNYWYAAPWNMPSNEPDYIDNNYIWNGPSYRYLENTNNPYKFWWSNRTLLTNQNLHTIIPQGMPYEWAWMSGATTFDEIRTKIMQSYNANGNEWLYINDDYYWNTTYRTHSSGLNICYTVSGLTVGKKYTYVFVTELAAEYEYTTETNLQFNTQNLIIVGNGSTQTGWDKFANNQITLQELIDKYYLHVDFYNTIN